MRGANPRLVCLSAMGLLVLLTVPVLIGRAAETRLKLEDCPQAVQDTIKKEVAGGTLKEVEKEVEKGRVVYEAEFTLDGKTYELEVDEAGKVLQKKLEADDDDDDEDDDDEDDD